MEPTIKDIAELSGYSTATVSRVLNNPDKVAESTKDDVLRVIEEKNYEPNQLARNFSQNVSNNIALFVYDLMNPFFTRLSKEINEIALENGYTLMICDTENKKDRELDYINYISKSKFAGLILTEGILKEPFERMKGTFSIVSTDRVIGSSKKAPVITSDNRSGARRATEYLVNLGHERIGFISGPEGISTARDRKRGYLDIVEKYDLPVDKDYIYTGNFRRKSGIKGLEYFLSMGKTPTAVFCGNDLMARGLLSRAFSLNIEIPDDLSVIGFDGVSDDLYFELTTIKQSIETLAKETMGSLFREIDGKEVEGIKKIPVELQVGETCQKNKNAV